MTAPPLRALIVGAGLMGTSLGLALRRAGTEAYLEDIDPNHVRLALSLGAGRTPPPADFGRSTSSYRDIVVVAVPPAVLGATIADALTRFPSAVVTDLGSVKVEPATAVTSRVPEHAGRYVGGHPMAGSEQSGPLAARADLFDGRAWAVTPHTSSRPEAIAMVGELAELCRAFAVRMSPAAHDEAVALVSHLPQVASSVVASLLAAADEEQLLLAGQGLRDVTRIAAGDPELWTQILTSNAEPVAKLLHESAERLHQLAVLLEKSDPAASPEGLRAALERGVAGVRRLPGKHGMRPEEFAVVTVQLRDQPGELARLFADVSAAGVNIEDVRIDHSPGTPAGLAQLAVHPDAESTLLRALAETGWDLHG
ncbi:MAG TPA: prephenate dehydrogenase [Actinopolymorphaceae bacterium]